MKFTNVISCSPFIAYCIMHSLVNYKMVYFDTRYSKTIASMPHEQKIQQDLSKIKNDYRSTLRDILQIKERENSNGLIERNHQTRETSIQQRN